MRAILLGLAIASSAHADTTAERPAVTIKTKVSKAKTQTTLTVAAVSSKVLGVYGEDIQRCVRDRFGDKAKTGTLKLAFGVEADGTTIGVVAASYDKRADACIAERARSWRFDPPRDKANTPVATSFVLELALAPLPRPKYGPSTAPPSQADVQAFADMLTAESSADMDLMSNRKPGADLGAQLDGVKSPAVGTGSGLVHGGDKGGTTRPSYGRITVSSKAALDETTLTPEVVLRKIQSAYMAGLKRCYKDILKANPAATGKLKLSFTVDATGRTKGATATSFNAGLDACVKGLMSAWRFPAPTAGDQETTARFDYGLLLVPD